MKKMLLTLVILAVASQTSAETVPANTDPIVAYRAYEAAVTAGNLQDAAVAAHQAWQLAETQWGASNASTASLAYNASWSALLVGKGPERLDAARRAVELALIGKDAYTLDEAKFLLGYGSFLALPEAQRKEKFGDLAAAALPVEATWADGLIVDALMHAANASVGPGRGRVTMGLADRALAATTRVSPDNNFQKALAITLRGQGRLFTRRDFDEAKADFVEARIVYGTMQRTDDPAWGQLAAWETAANALDVSNGAAYSQTGTRIARRSGRPISLTEEQTLAIYGRDYQKCDGVKRLTSISSSITYPPEAARDGMVAGIVVRTDIAPDGSTRNVRLLGAVPRNLFGEAAVRGVQNWKYEVPAGTSEKCMKDRDIFMSFSLE